MPAKEPLSDDQVEAQLASVPAWSREGDKIFRAYVFKNFVEAFGFMASAALVAEKLNHHPDWSNVWKTVRVHLTTHEAGGLTALDFELARAMDELAGG